MSHSFVTKLHLTRKTRLNYFSYKVWRAMYLISVNTVHHTSEKKLRTRGSTVPYIFIGHDMIIHSGKRWHSKYTSPWLVGFKVGEFTWNRRYALFKAKQLRKKNKKKLKNQKKK